MLGLPKKYLLLCPVLLFFLLVSSCTSASPEAGDFVDSGAAEEPDTGDETLPGYREPAIMFYPSSTVPGNFTILAVGPLPEGASVRVESELPLSVSPPYLHRFNTYFILGIGFQAQPGSYPLTLTVELPGGEPKITNGTLEVAAQDFETISFSVSEARTSGWSAEELEAGREKVRQARKATEPYPLWHQPFILPLEGRISSGYGQVRIINQGAPSHHNGIDIPAETGTAVKAMNDGVIRLAERLLAHGNIVIIDHGMDLSSSYLHLDSIAVQEGQKVSRGDVIGAVGDTGFSTGPHLHWEVNLGLQPMNPLQLVQGDLLYLPTSTTGR
jgi:hypothetical protein